MAIRLTKTSKVIFAVVITILSVALGFLIWRVNQVDQLDPGDSDAGQGTGGECVSTCSCDVCKNSSGHYLFPLNGSCPQGYTKESNCTWYNANNGNSADCYRQNCGGGQWIMSTIADNAEACKDCGWDSEDPSGECDFGKDCPACPWPTVGYCDNTKNNGTCECRQWDSFTNPSCNWGNTFNCEASCPTGYESCTSGESGCQSFKEDCLCPECENKTYDTVNCKPVAVNTCDGGNWISKPTGNINYETDISFSAKAKDKDGIKKSSIVVKKGDTTLPVCSAGQNIDCISLAEATTETTISGNLSTAGKRLAPGNYTVNMSWKDNKDASSTACALTTSFTVLPQQTNPNWNITKSVVEQCVEEGTANPKSELTYTITVKNTGDGAGTISKIEDVLDSKVIDSFVQASTITSPGAYSAGKIIWNYPTPLSIAAGASKVFTYKLEIDKDHFDTYSNTVTLTPVGSATVQAAANITADCEITEVPVPEGEVPQTGVFDTTLGRIVAGFTLILFGVVVYNVPNGIFKKQDCYKYRDRFEKKVANR